jgi:alanyl-tRNA synthetase
MLGNWSLGDYFKKDAIAFSCEFLTSRKWLGFSPELLSVTCFAGDNEVPRDDEAAGHWKAVGIPEARIHYLGRKDNWWGPAGQTGPCGPDTEMFIDTQAPACGPSCKPGCHCGKYIEVWNDVFMQYNKTAEGSYPPLAQKTVDTGMGVDRTLAMIQGKKTVFETELFRPIIGQLQSISARTYGAEPAADTSFRIVADHMRSSVFIIGDDRGVKPSNIGQGYMAGSSARYPCAESLAWRVFKVPPRGGHLGLLPEPRHARR